MDSGSGDQPALAPPSGQISDFTYPAESLQPLVVGTLALCLSISTLSALFRILAQLHMSKSLAWADLWIALAWASHVAFAAMLLTTLQFGAGTHQWDVRWSSYYSIEFFLYVSFVLYDLAIVGAKVAILLQLSALFAGARRNWFYWASVALIIINVVFYIALSFALIFQCKPLEKAWNNTVEGHCVNQDSLLTSSGPFNIVSDLLIFLLPLFAIFRLQLPLRRRLEVVSAFTIGLFGCICSAVRLAYSKHLSETGDATWVIMQNQLWANAEITAGVLISSIFILPRFFRRVRNKMRSWSYPSNQHTSLSSFRRNKRQPGSASTWSGRHRKRQNERVIRDPYFELTEIGNAPDESSVSVANNASREHLKPVLSDRKDKDRERESMLPIAYPESAAVRPLAVGIPQGAIMKTVQIESSAERFSPTNWRN